MDEPVKLLIATAVQGGWNLLEVYERELWKRNITLEDGLKHVIFIDNPQQLTDEEVNILYNVADISLSVVDGEGFGLCNFQQAAIGRPQIVPKIGGFLDFFNDDTAIMLEPRTTFYIDSARDGVGGEAQLVDFKEAAVALERYYKDADLRKSHGVNARKKILTEYRWEPIGDKLYDIIMEVYNYKSDSDANAKDTSNSNQIDIKELKDQNKDQQSNNNINKVSLESLDDILLDVSVEDKIDVKPNDKPQPQVAHEENSDVKLQPEVAQEEKPDVIPQTEVEKIPIKVVQESDDETLKPKSDIKKSKKKKKAKVTQKEPTAERLKKKLEQKQQQDQTTKIEISSKDDLDMNSLLELRNKIDKLLAAK
jgi:hypothetical protein